MHVAPAIFQLPHADHDSEAAPHLLTLPMTVDIYTTPQCGFCKQLKMLLQQEGVSYTEHDVTKSDADLQEMQKITGGALSVPVVVTNRGADTQRYAIGFDAAKKFLNLGGEEKITAQVEEMAVLTCPKCHHAQSAPIPTTSCVPFYICEGCKETIQAAGDDCCVFCSFADRPCPLKSKHTECSVNERGQVLFF